MSKPPNATAPHANIHRLINHLMQLQDLIYARDQQQASSPGSRLAQLDASIKTLTDELPDEIRSHVEKMNRKGGPAIVPIANGVCSACGMAIPVSQVHAVHAADNLYRCPNCARYLMYPESPIRRAATAKRRRGEPMQVGISRFSSPQLMMPRLKVTTRDELIQAMATHMQQTGFVDSSDKLVEECLRREAIMSTAVDQGLAFPHVRGVEGGGVTLALATLAKGVKFTEGNRNLTRLVFFIVIPTAASAFYLRLLSGLTKTFRDPDIRDLMLEAKEPEDLWKLLVKLTRGTVA
ncbi:MAG TPA: PTS sugar transporter subunit IIA [Kiritimatiellia bacterium]|nr:PTS sugar transporter subunit IIA [Kiritimatiellia bacterium]